MSESLANEIKMKINSTVKQIRSQIEIKEISRVTNLTSDQCKKLCEACSFKYSKGYEERVIERTVTTEAVDRDGDIIRAKGVDNKEYRIEPVVLFAHDKYNVPIGRSLKEWIDNKINGWLSWDLYFDNDIDTTGRSDLVFRMVNSGAMRGGSIGFLPVTVKCDHPDEDRKKLGLGKYGVEFLKVKKIEHSACTIPANQEALSNNLKSLDSKILKGNLNKSDLDIMEKYKMIENNYIDVFYSVLGIDKTIVDMKPVKSENDNEKDNITNINLTVDMSKATEKMVGIENKITELSKNIDSIQKSVVERFNSLIAIAEKLINASEQKNESGKLYDNVNTKDIEDILKLK